MTDENQKPKDDFFALLADEDGTEPAAQEDIVDPFIEDEIVFKDETGQLKTLKGGQINSLETAKPLSATTQPQPIKAVAASTPLNLDQEVASIVQKSQINFSDSNLKSRFDGIIRSRLKGIRDQLQTREILLASPAVGGLGLDESKVEQILRIVSQESQDLDDRLRLAVSSEPFADLKEEVNQILQTPDVAEPAPLVFGQSSITPPAGPKTLVESRPSNLPKSPESKPTIKLIDRKPSPAPTQRPKIEDVKFRPRLLGPIEEISSLTLADFRRLSPEPEQAAENILDKIKLLEQDSFSDLIEGIKAWQHSEINQLYLTIGHQSMDDRQPVAEVIQNRQKNQIATLTNEEFEAIADLNRKLRH